MRNTDHGTGIVSRVINIISSSDGCVGTGSMVGLLLGAVDAILLLRFVLKLLGASPGNFFVNGIYGLTQPVVGIFEGIVPQVALPSINATANFEPATLIVMIGLALIVWVLRKIS